MCTRENGNEARRKSGIRRGKPGSGKDQKRRKNLFAPMNPPTSPPSQTRLPAGMHGRSFPIFRTGASTLLLPLPPIISGIPMRRIPLMIPRNGMNILKTCSRSGANANGYSNRAAGLPLMFSPFSRIISPHIISSPASLQTSAFSGKPSSSGRKTITMPNTLHGEAGNLPRCPT